mmetsp:Transcript_63658/g.145850  ORF Transcript_63658/g.145850 Transcript_63658/m.145850 type:complete len:297 (+) Transcript_63658:121-1011(+)
MTGQRRPIASRPTSLLLSLAFLASAAALPSPKGPQSVIPWPKMTVQTRDIAASPAKPITASPLRAALHLGGFGLLAYGLWLQVLVAPAPQAGWSKGVDKVFGKWIFLTTQSLFMLTGYFLVNVAHESSLLLGLRSARLQRLAYWLSPVAGGFGIFLTMMFYLMVWSSKAFQLNSVQFWHDRGLPFAYWQHMIHAPSVLLVTADALSKHSGLVRLHVDKIGAYIPLFAVYGTFYTVMIRYNFSRTERWPYPFLGQFTEEWQHWAFYVFSFSSMFACGAGHRLVLLARAALGERAKTL